MPVTAKLKLEQNNLLWGQTTKGMTEIINGGGVTLEYLNYENDRAQPTFVLTDLQKGEVTEFSQKVLPGGANYEVMVKPGEEIETNFELCYKVKFPSPGAFEVKTRFEWLGGNVESEPVRVQILPTSPRARSIATAGGGSVGDVFCAWVNAEDGDGGGLWLSSIGAITEARFQKALRLGSIPSDTVPVLSVPPNTSPTNQYVGWLEGQTLKYVVHNFGRVQTAEIPLVNNDYKIIAPLLEDPFTEPHERQYAEALLIRQAENGWEMRLLSIPENGKQGETIKVQGAIPDKFYTLYRSDTERRTVFWQQSIFSNQKPAAVLSISNWAKGKLPQPPQIKAIWEGKVIAADQSLTGDDSVVGAVLLKVETDEKFYYELRKWRLDPRDNFTESPAIPVLSHTESVITEAILRIRPDWYVFGLLRYDKDKLWRSLRNDDEVKLLSDELQNINGEINIFFVNQTTPAILYTDPECGLRIAFDGPAPKRFLPAGF